MMEKEDLYTFRTSTLDNSNGTPKFGSMSFQYIYVSLGNLGHIFPTIYEGYSNFEDVSSLLYVSNFFHMILFSTAIQERKRDIPFLVTA